MIQRSPPFPARRGSGRVLRWAGAVVLGLAGCGGSGEAEPDAAEAPASAPFSAEARSLPGTLAWALEGPWRPPEERARDAALQPVAIAELFALDSAPSVLELHPGRGAWTAVIAPTVAARCGGYPLAGPPADAGGPASELRARLADRFADEALFGPITISALGPETGPLAPANAIAAAFTVDDVATWMALGYADKAFADVYDALAPGGRFGVIQPRAAAIGAPDPTAASGYVQQAYVIRLAEEAGFELLEASERLANPTDTRDHAFGVWTLAPFRMTAPLGAAPDPTFDRAPYDAIGEPDRMTLVFRKPFAEEPTSDTIEADTIESDAPENGE